MHHPYSLRERGDRQDALSVGRVGVDIDATSTPHAGPMDTTPAIRIATLTKSFGVHEVLRGVDLDIERGSNFALIGSNGAGKTTFLLEERGWTGWTKLERIRPQQ